MTITRASAALTLVLAGCGAAASLPPTTPETPAPAATDAVADTGADPAEAEDPSPAATCDSEVLRDAAPTGSIVARTGPLTLRAGSLVLDDAPEGPTVTVCVATRPLPAGARLVLEVSEYGDVPGTWDGTTFVDAWGTARREDGDPETPAVVVLPGQEITAVRDMRYCPTDPSRPCLAVGSYEALRALGQSDPNGPRSGWDFTETAIVPGAASSEGQALTGRVCGLTVRLRTPPPQSECTELALDARLACMSGERIPAYDIDDTDAEQRGLVQAQEAAVLALSDGAREVVVPAYGIDRIACAEGAVLILRTPVEFASTRAFTAIDVARRRIVAARSMSIRDHEESSSECGNAWDGVELVPIVARGALVGAVVHGAGGTPRFDVGRGDVGDVPRDPEPERPLAFRPAGAALERIETGGAGATRTEACPLLVADEDGETNVRPAPSTRRPPVGTLRNGTPLEPVEQRGRWYRIERPLAGWVWSEGLARRCP